MASSKITPIAQKILQKLCESKLKLKGISPFKQLSVTCLHHKCLACIMKEMPQPDDPTFSVPVGFFYNKMFLSDSDTFISYPHLES